VGSFVLAVVALLLLFLVLLYPAAVLLGRVPLRAFAKAAVPAQAVAIGTRSSVAALPALLEGGAQLGLPSRVNAFVMPLAVSVFKANRTLSGPLKMLFLAHVYDIPLTAAAIAAFVGMELLLSAGSPGTPQGGTHPSTVILLAMGVPMEGIALLHALYALPDVFMTLTNVTADLAAGAMVARFARVEELAGAAALEAAAPA
jgi:Na+/H+-dicarboxylate symporter